MPIVPGVNGKLPIAPGVNDKNKDDRGFRLKQAHSLLFFLNYSTIKTKRGIRLKNKKEQGKYPVINLNLKSVESNTWKEMYSGIKEIIRQLYESKRYVTELLNDDEKTLYQKFLIKEADSSEYKLSLKILSQYLYKYYNEKVTFLDLDKIETEEANDTVLNFLLVSGYLTKTKESNLVEQRGYLTLKIPNEEVRTIFTEVIAKWIGRLGKEQIINKEYYKELELDRVENILTYAVEFKVKECRVK